MVRSLQEILDSNDAVIQGMKNRLGLIDAMAQVGTPQPQPGFLGDVWNSAQSVYNPQVNPSGGLGGILGQGLGVSAPAVLGGLLGGALGGPFAEVTAPLGMGLGGAVGELFQGHSQDVREGKETTPQKMAIRSIVGAANGIPFLEGESILATAAKNAAMGYGIGSLGNASEQYVDTGKVDLNQVMQAGGIGAVMGGATSLFGVPKSAALAAEEARARNLFRSSEEHLAEAAISRGEDPTEYLNNSLAAGTQDGRFPIKQPSPQGFHRFNRFPEQQTLIDDRLANLLRAPEVTPAPEGTPFPVKQPEPTGFIHEAPVTPYDSVTEQMGKARVDSYMPEHQLLTTSADQDVAIRPTEQGPYGPVEGNGAVWQKGLGREEQYTPETPMDSVVPEDTTPQPAKRMVIPTSAYKPETNYRGLEQPTGTVDNQAVRILSENQHYAKVRFTEPGELFRQGETRVVSKERIVTPEALDQVGEAKPTQNELGHTQISKDEFHSSTDDLASALDTSETLPSTPKNLAEQGILPPDLAPFDPRPEISRKGGMTVYGERGTYHSLNEMLQYQPGIQEALTPHENQVLAKTFAAIQSGQALQFDHTAKVHKSSQALGAHVFPMHVDNIGNSIRVIGLNDSGHWGQYIVAEPNVTKNGKPYGISSIPEIVTPNEKQLGTAQSDAERSYMTSQQIQKVRGNFTTFKQAFPQDAFIERSFQRVFGDKVRVHHLQDVLEDFSRLPESKQQQYLEVLKKKKLC
jgi:hypothetical protein